MAEPRQNRKKIKTWAFIALLLAGLGAVTGCQTMSFYKQAVAGQYELFANQTPIDKIIADAETPSQLKHQLELVQHLRAFAHEELKLPVNGHYARYVDLRRPYVVWNIQAAPEFSLEPRTWWYPLVGSLEYRGYFAERNARNYAEQLRAQGSDVSMGGVQAYSTLGWFKDPVLNTFIFDSEPELAETIFHELGHQRVFARGDTDFNEAFATTVGREGVRRWFQTRGDSVALAAYEESLRRHGHFVALVMNTRAQLEALYGDERDSDGKIRATRKPRAIPPEELRREKRRILAELRQDYSDLKAQWGGRAPGDGWFSDELNNAMLNSIANYYDLVPGFERLLEIYEGDLEEFYVAVERLSRKSRDERHEWLRILSAPRDSDSEPLVVESESASKTGGS